MYTQQYLKKHFRYFLFFYFYLRWRIIVSFILSFLTGILDGLGIALFIPLLQIVFNEDSVDTESSNFLNDLFFEYLQFEPDLITVFLLILSLFSLKGFVKFIDSYLKIIWQQKMMREIRFQNIYLLSHYKYAAFVKLDTGRIQNTLGAEVSKVNQAYKLYLKTINFLVLVIAYFSFSLGINWQFTLLVLIGGVIINLFSKFLYKRTKYFSKKLVAESHFYHKLLFEKINLFKYLKATGLIRKYNSKLKENIFSIENVQRKLGIVDALLIGIREPLIILVTFGAIFLYTILFEYEITGILLSLLFIYRAFSFFMASQEQWNLFLGNSGSLENIQRFSRELKIEQDEKEKGKSLTSFSESVELKNVSFKYGEQEPEILKNISFCIKKNSSIAIVGPSGSGKTTLMNIITGLLTPTKGDIYIDGINFKDLNQASYRGLLGYIVQDATIFNDTVFNNVTFWDKKNKENLLKYREAVKKSKIDGFITKLPQKEDSLLGISGVNISGGQKQRISIARELYKNVDFLFMDEATSSLDTETELRIQKNIDELKGKYTFISIAHRLTSIKNADFIILLEDGEIKAIGNYTELLNTSPSFKRMVKLQEL